MRTLGGMKSNRRWNPKCMRERPASELPDEPGTVLIHRKATNFYSRGYFFGKVENDIWWMINGVGVPHSSIAGWLPMPVPTITE